MNFPTVRFPVFFSVATNLVDMEIFILKPIEESPPMSAGRGDWKKFTQRTSDRVSVLIGNGRNWIAATAPMRC